jgi:hypothetical protein
MQGTGIEMPDAFPAVVIAIRPFLSSPMRAVTIETDTALSWQADGPWMAHLPDATQTRLGHVRPTSTRGFALD